VPLLAPPRWTWASRPGTSSTVKCRVISLRPTARINGLFSYAFFEPGRNRGSDWASVV
jgi:hypothetical protein